MKKLRRVQRKKKKLKLRSVGRSGLKKIENRGSNGSMSCERAFKKMGDLSPERENSQKRAAPCCSGAAMMAHTQKKCPVLYFLCLEIPANKSFLLG